MEYGYGTVLIAEGDGHYQVVGLPDNEREARLMAAHYVLNGPEQDFVAPVRFVLHRRGQHGYFSETIELL